MFSQLYESRHQRFLAWVDRRMPRSLQHRLNQSNLFIFPTRRGFVYFLVIATLWVLGTNYQNNLILALAFFMVSVFVICILHTFSNLNRLQFRYVSHSEVFAGGEVRLRFTVHNPRKTCSESIDLAWQYQLDNALECVFEGGNETEVSVPLFIGSRGHISLPRMRVQSVFPFGILRCWTWLNWDISAQAYPKPISAPLGQSLVTDDIGDGLHPVKGGEDFGDLRTYRAGDPIKNIAWKVFARGQGVFVKEFSQNLSRENWLDFDSIPRATAENKLSILCFWVLQMYQNEENFGLCLPGVKVEPAAGYAHRTKCLQILAEYKL